MTLLILVIVVAFLYGSVPILNEAKFVLPQGARLLSAA